jgi:hypothetical protein
VAGQLESVLAYLDDSKITAKSDGVVSAVNVAEGEETRLGSGFRAVHLRLGFLVYGARPRPLQPPRPRRPGERGFRCRYRRALKMTISVDELDICSVTLGQEASVTLVAISSEKFTATVTRISGLGSADGSITTFPVETDPFARCPLPFGHERQRDHSCRRSGRRADHSDRMPSARIPSEPSYTLGTTS